MNDVLNLLNQQTAAFADFKARHSNELDEIKHTLRTIEAKGNRPGAGIDMLATSDDLQHKNAFMGYVRGGEEAEIKSIEAKALNVGTPADGGYAVPKVIDQQVQSLLRASGSLRAVANVQTVPAGYRKLVSVGGAGASWVGETDARTATTSPQLSELVPFWGEIYANPQATQYMLDDAQFDAGEWLANELAEEFALTENASFLTGNGTNKPKGLLTYTFVETADASRAFGQLQKIKTGVAGGLDPDALIKAVYTLAAPYRANATWAMNSNTIETVRKLKGTDGQYLWRDGLAEGQPATLLGYPVIDLPDMPDIANNALPILFGDFQRGYMITDRQMGTRVLRDPYSNKPYVGFYTTRRVGGMLVDSRAIKAITTAA